MQQIYIRLSFILLVSFLFLSGQNVDGQNTAELYRKGLATYKNKNYQQALSIINEIIQADSSTSVYYILRAKIYFKQNNYDNTIRDCYSALKLMPNDPDAYMLRGNVCMVTKSYGGAILFFGKTLNNTTNKEMRQKAFVNRGNAYYKLGRFGEAQHDLLSAYAINQHSTDILYPLAETYIKLDQNEKALATLDTIIAGFPDYAPAYRLLGTFAAKSNDYEKAIQAYGTYLTLDPKSGASYLALADIYLRMKNYDQALFNINKASAFLPKEPKIFKIKSEVSFAKGLKNEGCNNLFRAFQLGYNKKYGYGSLDEYICNCENQ